MPSSIDMPNALLDLFYHVRSIDEVMKALPELRWGKVRVAPDGGHIVYAVIVGNRETHEKWVACAAENGGTFPLHQHGAGGEMTLTISGILTETYEGKETELAPGSVLFRGGGTIHSSKAEKFWFGIYYQPDESKEVK